MRRRIRHGREHLKALELICQHGALTRGDVLEITGLSRTSVYGRIDALLDANLIVETGSDRDTGGRPSRHLEFNPGHASILVATVDTTHSTVALTDSAVA